MSSLCASGEPVDANQMGRETSMRELALDVTQQVLHPEIHGKFLVKVLGVTAACSSRKLPPQHADP
jgi:hypothetical protein